MPKPTRRQSHPSSSHTLRADSPLSSPPLPSCTRVISTVLLRQGTGALLNAVASEGQEGPVLPLSRPQGQLSHLLRWQERQGHLSLTHTTTRQRNDRTSFPMISPSGQLSHNSCNQGQLYCSVWARCRAHSPALMLQRQLSQDARVRVGPVLPSLQTSTWLQEAAQTRHVHLAFGGNRLTLLQGHRPRHGF